MVAIGMFKPGSPENLSVKTVGPSLGMIDCNNNEIDDACDNDGDRDLRDVAAFQWCFSGARGEPGYVVPPDECLRHCDFEEDDDVDLLDFKELQENLPVR